MKLLLKLRYLATSDFNGLTKAQVLKFEYLTQEKYGRA